MTNALTSDHITRLCNLIADTLPLCDRALHQWGPMAQEMVAVEECAELIQALMHEQRGRKTNVPTEIADVLIMALQMALLYGMDDTIDEIAAKTTRLKDRIKAGD